MVVCDYQFVKYLQQTLQENPLLYGSGSLQFSIYSSENLFKKLLQTQIDKIFENKDL